MQLRGRVGERHQAGQRRLHVRIRRRLHRHLRQQRASRRRKIGKGRRRREDRKLEGGQTDKLQHYQGEEKEVKYHHPRDETRAITVLLLYREI